MSAAGRSEQITLGFVEVIHLYFDGFLVSGPPYYDLS